MRRISWVLLGFVGCCTIARWAWANGLPPSETLLPSTTKGFISIPDLGRLVSHWEKTQLGQLMQDPTMKEFAEDLRAQLEDRLSEAHLRLGLRWEDVKDVPSGEITFARIQPEPGKASAVGIVQIAGRRKQAEALLEKITANLQKQGAKLHQEKIGGWEVVRLELPKSEEDDEGKSFYYLLTEEFLVAADDEELMRFVVVRLQGGGDPNKTLAAVPAFGKIMARCQKEAGSEPPQIRWFIEPFGYVEVLQTLAPERLAHRRKGRSILDVLKNQGFTAIQGVGGYLHFAVGELELLHRTIIYAPPPYEKSMRMVRLPNQQEFTPPAWVPKDVATYTSVYADILHAFDHFGPFFDDMFGEGEKGVWEEVLDGLKNDPNGPMIDLRNDLIVHLTGRAMMITDYELPITPTSERLLYALETKNEKALSEAIRRIMEKDRTMRRREYGGHVIWEAIPPEAGPRKPEVVVKGLPPIGGPKPKQQEPPPRVLPTAAVTVAYGHLLVASHFDFLKKVLDHGRKPDPLADRLDFQLVQRTIDGFGIPNNCARFFSRTDEEYRATYELIQQGKMPQSETLFGRLLNEFLGTGKKGQLRKQRIDGSKLPDYQVVARALGPAGLFAYSEQEGWVLVGFTMKKK
ncbi:MAG: DUF3352 domain-containing protein [Thermoguttaceae bacterium]|nr:DUF3352 domain-containing protein [Thermoguttaceae bacterium]MDW8036510.1 hypothetical protein [Thermoguttaceae bacterium]